MAGTKTMETEHFSTDVHLDNALEMTMRSLYRITSPI